MEMQDKLFRSCALVNNVQTLLIKFIKENDYEQLEDLLNEGRVNVNHVYKECEDFYEEDKSALQIACFATGTSEKCIQLLLDYGANIFYEDPQTRKNAIHFAAEGGNYKILQTILKYINKKNINISECNVIFTLIKYIRDAGENEEKYIPILELLLTTDIDINYQEHKSGWTAIYMAAKYKFKHFIKTLIEHHQTEIDIDDYKDKLGKSARDLIIELKLYNGELPEYREENSNITIHTLFKNLSNHKLDDFTINYNNIQNSVTKHDQEELLHRAVELGNEESTAFLLDKMSMYDLSQLKDEDNPLVQASMKGYYRIVKLLINRKPNGETVSAAIFKILKHPNISKQSDNVNYLRCLHLLLKCKNIDINYADWNKNTALHYALRYQNPEIALEILRNGASLASKDSFNNLAISDMDSTTLEQHLNECIRYENEEIAAGEDACLIINLTSLLPARNINQLDNSNTSINVESRKNSNSSMNVGASEQLVAETEVLQYMCCSEELKQHLKHPVILAFLYLKWHRIRSFFYINLAIYILFIISLLTYITVGYNNASKNEHKFLTNSSYIILTITFVILVIREMSQIIIYKYRYFMAFENWLEIVLLIVTAGILIEKSSETQTRQFSAIAIVAAAIEFLLLVGQFPGMSTNIMMLRTVSYTFFKLLLWYSILLIAFAYSFYTLFQTNNNKNGSLINNNNDTKITDQTGDDGEEEEEQDFFEDPGMSLLKTIVMLTGEFDAASIKFNSYPIISQLIFVMFVFLIAIVLFNLLNGLAVSDTQTIKNDAELYGQILRVEHIAHVEKVLLTNRLIRYIPKIKQICLFPLNVKKMEILVYPNQNSKVELIHTMADNDIEQERKPSCFKVFFEINLDNKIQKSIRSLMKQLKEESNKAKKDQEKLDEIMKLLKELINNKK